MQNNIIIFHGGTAAIEVPRVDIGRIDIDFGAGFYSTTDKRMAEKWACSKSSSYLNTYSLDMEGLNIKHLEADEEWLNFICYKFVAKTHRLAYGMKATFFNLTLT